MYFLLLLRPGISFPRGRNLTFEIELTVDTLQGEGGLLGGSLDVPSPEGVVCCFFFHAESPEEAGRLLLEVPSLRRGAFEAELIPFGYFGVNPEALPHQLERLAPRLPSV